MNRRAPMQYTDSFAPQYPGGRNMSKARTNNSFVVTWLMWGLLILANARVTILSRRRSTDDFDAVDGLALLAVGIIVGLGILLITNKRFYSTLRYSVSKSPRWLLLYLIICLASAVWSLNLPYTAFRAGEVLVILLSALVLMTTCKDFCSAEAVFLRFSMLSLLLDFTSRARYGFSLSALHTNSYTVIAGMGFVYCFGEWFLAKGNRKLALFRYSGIFLVLLAVGTSAGSNIATALSVGVVLILLRAGKLLIIPILIVMFGGLYVLGDFGEFVSQTLLPGKTIEQASTLHGREYLWTAYWQAFLDRPLFGYGFAVVSRYGSSFGIIAATNTHNGLLEVIVGTGLLGFVPFLAWLISLARELLSCYRAAVPGAVGAIGGIVMLLVNNMSKTIVGGAFDVPYAVLSMFVAFIFFHVHAEYVRRKIYFRTRRHVSATG